MSEEFGESYSEILKRDLHLHELNDKTANELLAEGEDPKVIWLAICKTQEVPKSRWAGKPVAKRIGDTQ
jgi:Protein of unknown function (DUF3046).